MTHRNRAFYPQTIYYPYIIVIFSADSDLQSVSKVNCRRQRKTYSYHRKHPFLCWIVNPKSDSNYEV